MEAINEWLEEIDCEGELSRISSEESRVEYYRLKNSMHSGVVVDFSEDEEAFQPFLKLNLPLYEAGVTVPKIFTYNREEFFVFMEDLGSTHLCDVNNNDFELFYDKAIDSIVKMQNTEIELLKEASFSPKSNDKKLNELIEWIQKELASQPQEQFVHNNYTAKNLMFNCNDSIVVIEYQGATLGYMTYDLVSLLRDVELELPVKDVERLALSFKEKKGLNVDDETFMKWFDLTGVLRHLSLLGDVKTDTLTKKYLLAMGEKYDFEPNKFL
jgi:aminoglycoside/choline kinase family phosphotransferase